MNDRTVTHKGVLHPSLEAAISADSQTVLDMIEGLQTENARLKAAFDAVDKGKFEQWLSDEYNKMEEDRERMASIMLDIAYGRYDVIGDTPEYMCWHNLPDHYTKGKKWPDGVAR